MICRKCDKEIPENSVYCLFCGAKQIIGVRKQRTKQRGNGQGTAFKRGNKWVCLYRKYADGKVAFSIYKGGFATKKEALSYLATINPATRTAPSITFAELYAKWIDRHATRVSKSTIDCYRSAYKYFERIYPIPFADLTTEHLQRCVDACPHGRRTKENMKALGTSLYAYAHEIGVCSEDYAKHLYLPRTEVENEKRAFTAEELKTLFEACSVGVAHADMVLILCYTGFRINELLKMTKESYDPNGAYLIGGSKTKAGKNRIVPISDRIRPFVEARWNTAQNGEALFRDERGKPMTTDRYRNIQSGLLKQLGLRDLTPHECRHTFATMLKAVDGYAEDKLRLMGHSDERMLLHYTHSQVADLRKIIDKLE